MLAMLADPRRARLHTRATGDPLARRGRAASINPVAEMK
jgi:hypothetical protein